MLRLLVVDDSNMIRRQIARSLELTNGHSQDPVYYDVEVASDGHDAMEKFRSFEPAVVTMDITMPGLDGLSCVTLMTRMKPETRILVISALADRPTAVEAVKRGARGFLLKPFSAEELHVELEELLRQPRRRRA